METRTDTPIIVLCGGLGSRLWPLTDVWPKALIPVSGKPCVKWIIEELHNQGYWNIILSVNAGSENEFRNSLGDKIQLLAPPTLTSGCDRILYAAHRFLDANKFLVIYGDDLTHTNYRALLDLLEHADAALATTRNVDLEFGLIQVDGNRIRKFNEKPKLVEFTEQQIWTGRVAMRISCLRDIAGHEDLAKNVFPAMLRNGKRLVTLNSMQPWYDVGSIAHYRRANEAYAKTVLP